MAKYETAQISTVIFLNNSSIKKPIFHLPITEKIGNGVRIGVEPAQILHLAGRRADSSVGGRARIFLAHRIVIATTGSVITRDAHFSEDVFHETHRLLAARKRFLHTFHAQELVGRQKAQCSNWQKPTLVRLFVDTYILMFGSYGRFQRRMKFKCSGSNFQIRDV